MDRTDLIASVYAAFRDGDGALLHDLLADTDWVEAEGMPYGGRYRGFPEIATKVFGPVSADVKGFAAIPDEILPAGEDKVLVLGHYGGSGPGGELANPFAHVWTVADNKVSHFVQYTDTHRFRRVVGI